MKKTILPAFSIMALLAFFSCDNQPVKPVDLADPEMTQNDTAGLENDVDYMEDLGVMSDSDFVELNDTTNREGISGTDSSAAPKINLTPPANSSLKTINAVFKSVTCNKTDCELFFESPEDGTLSFCGSYGEFVSADFRVANKELVGKSFMIIYKTAVPPSSPDEEGKVKKSEPCNIIIFAKQQ
ncbi:MAG: hypothetical protein ACKOYC_05270 [Bacteroidota bacterium]